MSKSTMIRKVARTMGPGISNKQFVEEIKNQFGATVQSRDIIGVLGSHKDRRVNCKAFGSQLELAKRFLRAIGNKEDAVRLLNIVCDNQNGKSEQHSECLSSSNQISASGGA